jgi:dTDP-4-amino-4,6-dideoxygalactose transaminase
VQLKDSVERDKFIIEMNTRGVMCRPAWTLNHRLPMYTSCMRDQQTNACWLEERIVNIPSGLKKNL